MDKKINGLSLIFCLSGFGASTLSINDFAQILGSLTAFISAMAVAYQVVVNTHAQSKLTVAQAEKEQAEADLTKAESRKAHAEAEKQEIQNDQTKNKRK